METVNNFDKKKIMNILQTIDINVRYLQRQIVDKEQISGATIYNIDREVYLLHTLIEKFIFFILSQKRIKKCNKK